MLAAASIGLALAPGPWNDKLMHHGVGTWSTHLVLVAPLILLVRAPPRAGCGDGSRSRPRRRSSLLALAARERARDREPHGVAGAARGARGHRRGQRAALAGTVARRGARAGASRSSLLAALIGAAFVDVASRKAESTQAPPASIERSVAEDPRLAIWPLVRDRIAERPWIGHGYGKEILGPELARDARRPHAHALAQRVRERVAARPARSAWRCSSRVLGTAAWRFAGYARSRDDALALAGIVGLAILMGMVVKNLTDDFFVRTNARFLWATFALLVAFGERRLKGSEPKFARRARAGDAIARANYGL